MGDTTNVLRVHTTYRMQKHTNQGRGGEKNTLCSLHNQNLLDMNSDLSTLDMTQLYTSLIMQHLVFVTTQIAVTGCGNGHFPTVRLFQQQWVPRVPISPDSSRLSPSRFLPDS